MTDINNLTSQDEPAASDLVPIWSTLAGGTRRLTMRALSLFIGGAIVEDATAAGATAGATAGAAAALPQVFATYAALQTAITAGQFSAPRFADVTSDESFDGLNSLYFVVANDPGLPIIR